MGDVVLWADGLGKRYRINRLERAQTLRVAVHRFAAAPLRRLHDAIRSPRDDELLWAVRDVSFELAQGEVLGVVGRNGAGKSTLLRILSRITEPTEGHAAFKGRLSSLLEVGTGFHPELTGRNNIYLNGAILGMRRTEVAAKFDSIVEFSGIEPFIDTPVKRYSSGMSMRLAFAVAAHLEPDILLVDEVLAVGDADFQKRCIGKMREATGEGRTVLFVSHNMGSIRALCDRAILLEGGRIRADGAVDDVLSDYLNTDAKATAGGAIREDTPRIGSGDVRIRHAELLDTEGQPLSQVRLGQTLVVVLGLEAKRPIGTAIVEVGISSADGFRITTSFSVDNEQEPFRLERGENWLSVELEPFLLPGHYALDLGVHAGTVWTLDYLERIVDFDVINVAETSADRYPTTAVRGYVRPPARWHAPQSSADVRVLDLR
jgi:lipopolysaccharide transport system ATP-binding protein